MGETEQTDTTKSTKAKAPTAAEKKAAVSEKAAEATPPSPPAPSVTEPPADPPAASEPEPEPEDPKYPVDRLLAESYARFKQPRHVVAGALVHGGFAKRKNLTLADVEHAIVDYLEHEVVAEEES